MTIFNEKLLLGNEIQKAFLLMFWLRKANL